MKTEKPFRFHPAELHQGMRMRGETGLTSIKTIQGEVVLLTGDLVVQYPNGTRGVMRKAVADQAYGVNGLP